MESNEVGQIWDTVFISERRIIKRAVSKQYIQTKATEMMSGNYLK